MSRRLVSEVELRQRLSQSGVSVEEIEGLIGSHIDATNSPSIDSDVISDLLQKSQQDSVLRVRGFRLTKEQYDALAGYFDDGSTSSDPDAGVLVQRTVEEFVKLIG